jgi:hypothetical protein
MDGIYNAKLHEVVRALYDEIVGEFIAERDPLSIQSEEFLSSFPYSFMRGGGRAARIAEAGLLPEFRAEAEKCIEGCYANCSGGDIPFYLADAVEDFLNYIIPRSIALPNKDEIFDRYYRQFDSSIYGKSCLVTTVAVIRDCWDNHGGARVLPHGMRFMWVVKGPASMSIPYTRERAVPFFEMKKSAHLESDAALHAFNILQYSKMLPKDRNILGAAYSLSHDTVAKFLLAARLKTYSTAHSDYRGFRMLGHLSGYSMNLMHYPDDRIERGEGRDIDESAGMAIDRLLTRLLPQSLSKYAVVNQKVEDAMRRQRRALRNDSHTQRLNEIDQLIDYFQILEAIIPVFGNEYIALYAARLLRASNSVPNETFELYRFIKDMYGVRNQVMHGRVDEVLSRTTKESQRIDIYKLRHIVYSLACLRIMNDNLRDAATRLALGETVQLEREYDSDPQSWIKRHREALVRNANIVFW